MRNTRARIDVTQPGYHKGRVPANKGKRYPAEILTPEEVNAILAACGTTVFGVRNRALFTTLYRAGLRISEALALFPKDIDFYSTSIRVLHGKGDRARTVGIDPVALNIVGDWVTERERHLFTDTQPLYCTMEGRPLKSSYVRTVLPRLGRQVGIIKRVHPHGFRHTHAYELMMEGIPIAIIQRQLGHVSLSTTDTYLSHIAPRQVIDAIANREWTTPDTGQ
jgi:integrase/recombinase XerD